MAFPVLLLVICAAVISAVPLFWLALFTHNAVSNIPLFGFLHFYSSGYLLAALCAWVGVGAAVVFSRRALTMRSVSPLRSPWMVGALLTGLAGAAAIEIMLWSNPRVSFPFGFFAWPMLCYVGVGLLAPRLPRRDRDP